MEMTRPAFTGVTVGPDGTVIGRRVIGNDTLPFLNSLAMLWIELAWDKQHPECVRRLALLQDGLGTPGAVAPGLEYLPPIRASSFEARIKMLEVARDYVDDEEMAELLGLLLDDLRKILNEAYGL